MSLPNPLKIYSLEVLSQGCINPSTICLSWLSLNINFHFWAIYLATALINYNIDFKSYVMLSSFLVKNDFQPPSTSMNERLSKVRVSIIFHV